MGLARPMLRPLFIYLLLAAEVVPSVHHEPGRGVAAPAATARPNSHVVLAKNANDAARSRMKMTWVTQARGYHGLSWQGARLGAIADTEKDANRSGVV